MQGTPWHIEEIHHEKRDIMRCKHYDPFDKYCIYRGKKCVGTYYCMYYDPLKNKEYAERLAEIKKKKKQKTNGIIKKTSNVDNKKEKEVTQPSSTIKQTNKYKKNTSPPKLSFDKGTIVVHAGYGEGVVLNQEGDTIEIEYTAKIGRKKQKLSSLFSQNLLKKK